MRVWWVTFNISGEGAGVCAVFLMIGSNSEVLRINFKNCQYGFRNNTYIAGSPISTFCFLCVSVCGGSGWWVGKGSFTYYVNI